WYSSAQGRAYVFYGGSIVTENASGADVIYTGEAGSGFGFGWDIETGDFNADGTEDLAVSGVYYGDPTYRGRVYIFHGGSMSSSNASAADEIITGENTGGRFGSHMKTGDYNDDGKDDLAIGAYYYNTDVGRVYVFYNSSLTTSGAESADLVIDGETSGDYLGGVGNIVSGDINADGRDDLILGSGFHDSQIGRIYIFYGESIRSTGVENANVVIDGESNLGYGAGAGAEVGLADMDNNGVVDLIVAASAYGPVEYDGRVYILMSEASAEHVSTMKINGTVKFNGSVKFH
ncbi:FG-GAP repeat protein, partial [Candidatus Kaiserbacteria bacterium]|nr:FG-GAP repeat protein [Candidatus Kaiserbacteria bacterium]